MCCRNGKRSLSALLLALLLLLSSPLAWSQSSPTLPEELPDNLRAISTRLDKYATELSDFSEQSESRIVDLQRLSDEQQRELAKRADEARNLKQAFARIVTELNKSERDSQSLEQDKTRSIAQLQALEKKLADSEKSLQRLKRRMWIERVVLVLVAGATGYATAEIVDAVR